MTPLLRVHGLSKTYTVRDGLLRTRPLHAVRDVAFELHRGEAVALVGESGCGKSTTARMLAGLVRPTEGTVALDGAPALAARRVPAGYRRRVQMIFQDPFASLNPVHTLGYHLERPLLRNARAATTAEARARAAALLESVGLVPGLDFARKYPHETSGGQRQRVAIARALAVEPDLIIADEPTSMLDVSVRVGILNLLRDLKERRGIAFLYITHDLASARYFADRILVMHAGRIVEQGRADALLASPQHDYTRTLLAAMPNPRAPFAP